MKRVLAEFSNQPEVLEQLSEIMSDHFAHEYVFHYAIGHDLLIYVHLF